MEDNLGLFTDGDYVTVPEVLNNRDERVRQQQFLLNSYPDSVVVSFKMNTPGPIKNSPVLHDLFFKKSTIFKQILLRNDQIKLLATLSINLKTGPEILWSFTKLDGSKISPKLLKQQAVKWENASKLNRLFDVDVLIYPGVTLTRQQLGLKNRKCVLCNNDAKECARSRKHSFGELQNYWDNVYRTEYLKQKTS